MIDSGNPRLNSTTFITVTITDINDKPPILDVTSFETLSIEEDSEINGGSKIGQG